MIACSRQTVYRLESWSCQSCQSWSCVLLVVHIVLLLIVCVCVGHFAVPPSGEVQGKGVGTAFGRSFLDHEHAS